MAFDLSTAAPVASGGFDLSTAKPLSSGGGIPQPRRAWSDVPGEALANLPSSAGKFAGGLYEAVTSPVQTVKGLLDVGAGALQNALPKPVVDFINRFDANPEAAKRAVEIANAVGGQYKQDYGSIEGLKNKMATDPVGFASDLSTLLSGGAAAAGKISPTAGKVLSTAATYTNPATPIAAGAGYGIAKTSQMAGNAIDTLQGQRAAVRAGSIVRNALTEEGRAPENLNLARNALQNAPAGATVRQALADITSPQIQYLGHSIEGQTAPGAAMMTKEAQQMARKQRMEAVTPDEATAIAMRGNVSGPLYAAATQPGVVVDTAPLVQKIDSLTSQNPGNTKLVSALEEVKRGLEASTDAQQVSSVLDNLKSLIATKDNKFIAGNLLDVKKSIESALPGYANAQKVFAAASPPVNQARVLGAMQSVLEQPLGVGERAGPFMNAMGRGENALIKKATGEARFGGIEDILNPQQMGVVKGVESELIRDAKVAAQTKAGEEAMRLILEANKSKFRLPDFMDVKVTLANQMLKLMEGRLNKDVLSRLEKGFNSATSFEEMMSKVPASERLNVLRGLGEARGQLSPTKLNVLTQTQNALTSEQPQNALATRIDLTGMANK